MRKPTAGTSGAKGIEAMGWKRGEMCASCAGRKGTDANGTPTTMAMLAECIETGEPFFCHESTAVLDPNGHAVGRHGERYRVLPENRWRACRAWMNARIERSSPVAELVDARPVSVGRAFGHRGSNPRGRANR